MGRRFLRVGLNVGLAKSGFPAGILTLWLGAHEDSANLLFSGSMSSIAFGYSHVGSIRDLLFSLIHYATDAVPRHLRPPTVGI